MEFKYNKYPIGLVLLVVVLIIAIPVMAGTPWREQLPKLEGWGAMGKAVEQRLALISSDIDALDQTAATHTEEISSMSLKLYYAEGHIRVLEEQMKKFQEQLKDTKPTK